MYGVIEAEVFRPYLSTRDMAYMSLGIILLGEKPDIYKRPWVARIDGLDPTWGFKREFMRGTYDYTRTNNRASRGTHLYYAVPPGLYEVCRNVTWRRWERFFCRVDEDGGVHTISREEVEQCLKNAT